jgi:hypothetical protein
MINEVGLDQINIVDVDVGGAAYRDVKLGLPIKYTAISLSGYLSLQVRSW